MKSLRTFAFLSLHFLFLTLTLTADGVQPCSFNEMCACKSNLRIISSGQLGNSPVRRNDQGGIICVNVPFFSVPRFPSGPVSHIDLVNSGLEYLEATSLFHPSVKSLRLMSNSIKLIDNSTFSFIGESLRSLDLSYNQLDEVPRESLRLLKKVEWINLDHNQIASIDKTDFEGLEQLGTLFLAKNQITKIGPRAFSHLANLKWLNLDSNGLDDSDLPSSAFPKSLNTLFLAFNHLQEFPLEIVSKLRNITWLYLRGNHIRYLPSAALPHRLHLDKLDMSENFLPEIPANGTLFEGSLTAHDLYLDHNWFSEIPKMAFNGLQVKRLSLAHNRIEKIVDEAFAGILDSLISLDLEDNKLDGIPAELSRLTNLTLLYLSRNNISSIDQGVFQSACKHLEVLDLESNVFTAVPGDELRRCQGLTSLNLGHNQIRSFGPEDFAVYGRNMDVINLQSNKIERLNGRSFQHTPFLRELSLSFNPISYVAPDAFSDLSNSLEKLSLSSSLATMKNYPQDQLSYLRSVQWLVMDSNAMETLPDAALLFFTNLRFLNLEYNLLKAIPRTIFHSNVHSALVDIRLSYNRIEALERDLLFHLDMLQTVVLTGNRIRTIQTRAFSALPNLVTLSLDCNKLKYIEKQAFYNLPALMKLDLQENQLEQISLDVFYNVSQPNMLLALNLSRNFLNSVISPSADPLYLKTADLSFNHLEDLPSALLQASGPFLKELHLKNNRLRRLGNAVFRTQESLQVLDLSSNFIRDIHPSAFQGTKALQILDLSDNQINSLPPTLFTNVMKLRVVNLSGNRISVLPNTLFRDTFLEKLDLSENEFTAVPSQALEPINMTLRVLDLSNNSVQFFDAAAFENTRHLLSLNLAANQFRDVAPGVFQPLTNLLSLDLSKNDVFSSSISRAVEPLKQLKVLNLASCRLTEFLSTNMTSLTHLNLSKNELTARSLRGESLKRTPNLRELDLSHNKIEEIPSKAWEGVPHLTTLNLSGNLMSSLTKERFNGLSSLKRLSLVDLEHVIRFDSDSLSRLFRLEEVWLQTFPWIERYRFRLGSILGYLTNLRTIHVEIRQTDLSDQLHGAACPKLRELDITGENLKRIDGSAFRDIFGSSALNLRIRRTSVQKIPDNFLVQLDHIPNLQLDFSDNQLKSILPAAIYRNSSEWETIGTGIIAGGIKLDGNPLICTCDLLWMGKWLRRWLQESRDVHSEMLETAARIQRELHAAKCYEPIKGEEIALVELHEIDVNCSASILYDKFDAASVIAGVTSGVNSTWNYSVIILFFSLSLKLAYQIWLRT